MSETASIRRRLAGYADNGDPLSRASNRLALILAANQPFYPLYVWWVMGACDPALVLTCLSTPFFLAAPAITKRFPSAGRLYFPAVGAVNTFFCASIFGAASGVELFLAPCIAIAALSCRATERTTFGAFVAALLGALLLLHDSFRSAGQERYQALLSLNACSAATLTLIAVWMLSAARNAAVVNPTKP
jgi:hypothetical protein